MNPLPSPQLLEYALRFLARLHSMVGDQQALILLGSIDAALGHASRGGNEVSLQSAYDETTEALVTMIAVSTPKATITTTAAIIVHLHAVQALVKNHTLRN